jgi:inhibitor of KinA
VAGEERFQIEPQGDTAARILWKFGNSPAIVAANSAVVHLVEQAELKGLIAAVPGFDSVTVHYDPLSWNGWDEFVRALDALLRESDLSPRVTGRSIEIPVCYAPQYGLDLDEVAGLVGLSVAEVVQLHSSAEYTVQMLGFMPGFPYLEGLPAQLSVPRKRKPRLEVSAGSVAIGGSQTGVYPVASPGGWQVIGRTPLRLFDPSLPVPALLSAGDRVRFREVSLEEFAQLQGLAE